MERGFIQGKMEIKFLLLYILARAEGPMDLDTLTDVAMCDDGVSYFDFTTALAEIVNTEHVTKEEGRYTITAKGRKNGATMEDELPYSVRVRCDQKMGQVNARFRREKRIRTAVEPTDNGEWRVMLALDGEETPVFQLELQIPVKEEALRLAEGFRADPEGFCQRVRNL